MESESYRSEIGPYNSADTEIHLKKYNLNSVMKNNITKQLVLLLTLLTTPYLSFPQSDIEETVWVTVNDLSILPSPNEDGKIESTSVDLQNIINEYSVTSFEQILPSSRKEELLKVYEISCNCNKDELMSALMHGVPEISNPQPGPVYELLYAPDDYNLSFAEDYALDLINAQEAWDFTTGDTAVDIAILDGQYDLDHSELTGTISFSDPPTFGSVYHGTAVAITAAGNTDNAIGKSSIGSDCMLQLYGMAYDYMLIATYNGAKVINVSWYSSCEYDSYFQDVINEVYENGSIVVAAAGNGETCGGPTNYVYPAAFDHVIAVTSIGPEDNHERFIGDPSSTHQHNDSVDIAAPGYDVALTVIEGWYLTGNGTSFATPYVSGTIGLMFSANPCLSFEDVEYILKETAVNIDSLNPDYAGGIGAGRLDAAAAVEMAQTYPVFNIDVEAGYMCDTYLGGATVVVGSGEGVAPFSYEWSTGETEITIIELLSGTYEVTVTDAEGCKSYGNVTLDIPEPLISTEISLDVSCFGIEDGTINMTTSGGIAPYTFEWSNGETTEDLTELPVGSYALTITDVDECAFTKTVEIEEPAQLVLTVDIYCDYENYNSGEIDLTVEGGTPVYVCSWSNGEETQDIGMLPSGDYEVVVSDAHGCTETATATVNGPTLGIESNQTDKMILYPNPSNHGNVLISWSYDHVNKLEIVNCSGQRIKIVEINENETKINLDGLSAGIYLIKLSNDGGAITTQKLMVQ